MLHQKAITLLQSIKENISKKAYKNGDSLKADFQATISIVWDNLAKLGEADLSELYQLHKFLIQQVCHIHGQENCSKNEKLLSENLKIKAICPELTDGKRAFDIYTLNDRNWINYLVGDIHSDSISLEKILAKTDFFPQLAAGSQVRLVFLGDYVDRGQAHLKTMQYILTLKYLFPQNIILLMGNHDGGSFQAGKVKMWVRKPETDPEEDWFLLYLFNLAAENSTFPQTIITAYLEFFASLAKIAFICQNNKTILALHGGIPRPKVQQENQYGYIKKLADLTSEDLIDDFGKSIINNIIWSDPALPDQDLREGSSRFRFTEQQFEAFRQLIGFDVLIRGHQVQEGGYKQLFDAKLINIFSSGKILEEGKNINFETAYPRVNPHLVKMNSNGDITFIPLNPGKLQGEIRDD